MVHGFKHRGHPLYTIDMTEGPLLTTVLQYAVPMMLSGILQLVFNAADTIVVGRFSGNQALAAVGSVGSLNNMIISLFIGFSVGVNVLVARYSGARMNREVSDTVHTAVLLSVVGGLSINTHMEVLDASRRPIPGLYAVGDTTGGMYGHEYVTTILGNSHGRALTWGYLAAARIAGVE